MVTPTISYTERDYESVKQALFNWIKLRFPKDWPEFMETTVAKNIVEVVAWAHGQRAYYYDVQARNCYLETADLPEAVMALARQLGYRRRLATAASVPVKLYPNPPQAAPITIPKGAMIELGELAFEASDTYVIPASSTVWPGEDDTALVVFVAGRTRSEEFVSDGAPYQAFPLAHTDIIDGSITVSVLGEEWQEAPSLILVEGSGRGRDTFIGTGEDGQVYTLSAMYAIIDPNNENTLVVMVDGEKWQQVDEFTEAPKEFRATQDVNGVTQLHFGAAADGAAPEDLSVIDVLYQITGTQKRYTVDLDRAGSATIRFGGGEHGVIPPSGAAISISYRTDGGVSGNIRRSQLDGTVRGVLPSGAEVNVRAYNYEAGSGGEEIESLERVKFLAPRYAQANQRAVTGDDFAVLAMAFSDARYGAPAFASVRLKQRVPELNLVQVALWSRDNLGRIHTASSPLKQGVKSFLDAKRTICTYLEMVDGDVLYFDIQAKVLLRGGRTTSSMLSPVTATLLQHFNSTFVVPGTDLSLALLIEKLLSVEYVELTALEQVVGSRLQSLDLGLGDGTTMNFSGAFTVPGGVQIVPETFEFSDGNISITDDGVGNLVGAIDETDPTKNKINYLTGKFDVSLAAAIPLDAAISAEARVYAYAPYEMSELLPENKIDGVVEFPEIVRRPPYGLCSGISVSTVLPEEFLPYTPHRLVFLGGYDNYGTQPGGQLIAYDDGNGTVVGDVAPGGTVNYDTGQVNFNWNTTPPPVGTTDYWGYLSPIPDGVLKQFSFVVRTSSGGGGSPVNLVTANALGRLKFVLSDMNTVNVTHEDAYDNGQSAIHGPTLDQVEVNEVVYADPGLSYAIGTLTFQVAPDPVGGRDFKIQLTPTTLFLYAAFCAYLPGALGYDKIVVADNMGHLYGDVSEAYPYAQVDHRCGRYKANLTSPSAVGRQITISYDGPIGSISRDIPISHLTMPTLARVKLTEMVREVNV
jgi:hypothetical protein